MLLSELSHKQTDEHAVMLLPSCSLIIRNDHYIHSYIDQYTCSGSLTHPGHPSKEDSANRL